MKINPILIILLLVSFSVFSQNLVPNPGFEQYDRIICRRYTDKNLFSNALINWHSPTTATPDMYCLKGATKCEEYDYKSAFDNQLPRTGEVMVGIRMPSEYMETKLHKPLVPGRKYYVEMWVVAASKTSFVSNNIGIYFSDRFISNYSSKVSLEKPELAFTPQINSDEIIEPTGGKWTKISGVFTAESQAQYMTIGNFFGRGQTSYKRLRDIEKTESSYYYIDDLLVREADSSEIALYDSLERFKPGNIWELENISFKPGSTELLSSSASALDGLVNAMQNMPHLQIEISGHTDNKGNEATNLKLSEARAKAVKTYLQGKGISSERVTYKGYGSSRPIAENTTEEGRSRNRRVEIRIISNEQ